jgi:Domain of unknown function (DUF6249)
MNTPHTLADALIVVALAGAFVVWMYLRHKERQRRMEIVHQERVIAMDKGIPLPELPGEPIKPPADPRDMLIHGIAWVAMGLGGILALRLTAMQINGMALWPLPLPLLLLGVGLLLFYVLANPRSR